MLCQDKTLILLQNEFIVVKGRNKVTTDISH